MGMAIRESETTTVTVRESDLLECIIVAFESGEWEQVRRWMRKGKLGRCAYGVVHEVLKRADLDWTGVEGRAGRQAWYEVRPVVERAMRSLGYDSLDHANDAGCTFAQMAQALRTAREEMRG